MDLGLEGRSAIVTGGSLGIGTSVALTLAREGCDVAINYRRHDAEAKEVVRQIEALGRRGLAIQADVSNFADADKMVQTVVAEFGRLAHALRAPGPAAGRGSCTQTGGDQATPGRHG